MLREMGSNLGNCKFTESVYEAYDNYRKKLNIYSKTKNINYVLFILSLNLVIFKICRHKLIAYNEMRCKITDYPEKTLHVLLDTSYRHTEYKANQPCGKSGRQRNL